MFEANPSTTIENEAHSPSRFRQIFDKCKNIFRGPDFRVQEKHRANILAQGLLVIAFLAALQMQPETVYANNLNQSTETTSPTTLMESNDQMNPPINQMETAGPEPSDPEPTDPQPVAPNPERDHENESIEKRAKKMITRNSIILYLGENDELLGYSVKDKNYEFANAIPFSAHQKEMFAQAAEKAKASNSTEAVELLLPASVDPIRIFDYIRPAEPSESHPWIYEMPKDVLSQEDLQKKGLFIHQPDNSMPQLHIREPAFSNPDGLLHTLGEINAQEVVQSTHIFVVGGPYIDTAFLSPEQKEELEKHPEFKSFEKYTQINRDYISRSKQAQLAQIKNEITVLSSGQVTEEDQKRIIELKHWVTIYERFSGPDFFFFGGSEVITGIHINPTDEYGKLLPENFIIICVGDGPTNLGDKIGFTVDPDGSIDIQNIHIPLVNSRTLAVPNINRSYPGPEDYPVFDQDAFEAQRGYVYNQDPPFLLAHELRHAEDFVYGPLIEKIKKGEPSPIQRSLEIVKELDGFGNNIAGNLPAKEDSPLQKRGPGYEFDTNQATFENFRRAKERQLQTGDDSGFPFIFTIPPNIHAPEGALQIGQANPKMSI